MILEPVYLKFKEYEDAFTFAISVLEKNYKCQLLLFDGGWIVIGGGQNEL